jgi:triosephosphate isomerase
MRKKILAANWKMNLSAADAQEWIINFSEANSLYAELEYRLYAPSIYIQQLTDRKAIHVGAQNVHSMDLGAFTGEISIPQLKSVGAQSVLIGHSERRTFFNETDALLLKKVEACCRNSFSFIFCCGENEDLRNAGEHLTFIREQLAGLLSQMKSEQLELLTIAYEPIWAIGTGQNANIHQITEVHAFIRSMLMEFFGEQGRTVPILYGGSVNSENAESIFTCPEVDGGLIGGASLNATHFLQLASFLQ